MEKKNSGQEIDNDKLEERPQIVISFENIFHEHLHELYNSLITDCRDHHHFHNFLNSHSRGNFSQFMGLHTCIIRFSKYIQRYLQIHRNLRDI